MPEVNDLTACGLDDPAHDVALERVRLSGEVFYDEAVGEAVALKEVVVIPADVLSAKARQQKRDAMADNWKGLPDWLRGAFHMHYAAVVSLLDDKDDEAGVALIKDADPNEAIKADAERLAMFDDVKAQMVSAIQSL